MVQRTTLDGDGIATKGAIRMDQFLLIVAGDGHGAAEKISIMAAKFLTLHAGFTVTNNLLFTGSIKNRQTMVTLVS